MRLGTWLQHVDLRDNATLAEQWAYGNRSILGGLVGAWLGVHVAKRLCGYQLRTGDLFAPAVALGMAVGRIGCFLTEPMRGTGGHNVSFLYEIVFQLAAFAVIWWWLRRRSLPPGEIFVWYVAAYGVFRFLVEFVRGNEVVWHGLTRPQLFLAVTIPLRAAADRPPSPPGRLPSCPVQPRGAGAPVSTRTGPGMPLRGDRIHRYVNAFCPLCHEEATRPAAGRGAASVRLAGRARGPDLARARLRDPRPGPHAVRRVARDPHLPRAVDRPDEGAHPRRDRQLRARCPRRTPTACRRCRPSTPASCSRTCSTTATSSARPASPPRRRRWPRSCRSSRCWPRSTRGSPGRTAASTCSCSAAASPRSTRWLAELLDAVAERPIVRVLVNTNGLAIAQDDELLEPADAAPRAGRGLPAVRRRVGRGVHATTAAPTSAGSRSGRSSGSPGPGSSPRSR